VITETSNGARRCRAEEGGIPSLRHRARLLALAIGRQRGDGGFDQRCCDTALTKIGAKPGRPVPARAPPLDPRHGEGGIVDVTACDEIVDDSGRDVLRRAPPLQACEQVGACPRPTREQIGCDEPRGSPVERAACYLAALAGRSP